MVLSEILSTSFLFSIAIVIILVGGLFAYFNHRFSAQNHKISSMMGLVSTMAEEMQYFRSKLSGRVVQEKEKEEESCCKMPDADLIHIVPQFMGGSKEDLIEVSDEEDDDDLSEESASESASESDDDDLSASDESYEESDDEEQDSKVKSICIDLGNEIDINIGDEIGDEIGQEDSITISEIGNTKTNNLTEDISSFEITSKTLENINDIDIDISIKLTNDYSEKDKVDYKKMSINKLRDAVVEKGLVIDASKLKKNDILKMLGAEQ